MDSTPWNIPSASGMVLEPGAETSRYEALRKLSDPRRRQGKRYDWALILCLLVLALLAGQTSVSGATEWIRHRGARLCERFGLRRKSMPCQMTYCNVPARVDGKHLDAILSAFACRDGYGAGSSVMSPPYSTRSCPLSHVAMGSAKPVWRQTEPCTHAARPGPARASGHRWQNPSCPLCAAPSGPAAQLL